MLEKNKMQNKYWDIQTIINEVKEANGKSEPTAKEVLEYMIGDRDGWRGGDFVVYKYTNSTDRSFIQRLNLIWVYPLLILTIPFLFLFTGSVGLNRNNLLGRIIDRLVKFN